MQKYSNCTKWTINKVIIYQMNKSSHNELGKEAEQAYWNASRLFFKKNLLKSNESWTTRWKLLKINNFGETIIC